MLQYIVPIGLLVAFAWVGAYILTRPWDHGLLEALNTFATASAAVAAVVLALWLEWRKDRQAAREEKDRAVMQCMIMRPTLKQLHGDAHGRPCR